MDDYILEVNNLTIKNKSTILFDDLSFKVQRNEGVVALLCSNSVGKTTLIKTLAGILIPDSGKISVNNLLLSKKNFKKYIRNISTILEDSYNYFLCDTVIEELEYPLINLKYKKDEIEEVIDRVINITKINGLLSKMISELNNLEKVKLLLATSIVHEPSLIFIDDIFRFLNQKEKRIIHNIIKSINYEMGITFIYTTSDINDIINLDRVIVLNKGKIILDDTYYNIIYKDNELTKMGFEIPIMIDLSRKLEFYNLVDKIYYNRDEVINRLWK